MGRFALGSLDGRQLNRPRDHQAPLGGFAFQPEEVLELLLIRLALLPTETVDHRPSIPFPSTRGHGQENLVLNLPTVDFADRPAGPPPDRERSGSRGADRAPEGRRTLGVPPHHPVGSRLHPQQADRARCRERAAGNLPGDDRPEVERRRVRHTVSTEPAGIVGASRDALPCRVDRTPSVDLDRDPHVVEPAVRDAQGLGPTLRPQAERVGEPAPADVPRPSELAITGRPGLRHDSCDWRILRRHCGSPCRSQRRGHAEESKRQRDRTDPPHASGAIPHHRALPSGIRSRD